MSANLRGAIRGNRLKYGLQTAIDEAKPNIICCQETWNNSKIVLNNNENYEQIVKKGKGNGTGMLTIFDKSCKIKEFAKQGKRIQLLSVIDKNTSIA